MLIIPLISIGIALLHFFFGREIEYLIQSINIDYTTQLDAVALRKEQSLLINERVSLLTKSNKLEALINQAISENDSLLFKLNLLSKMQ